MRELCQTHKLAIAPDGKCVLCRRPSIRLFAVREEHETVFSRVFTGFLALCLLAGLCGLVYVSLLDRGNTGGRWVAGPPPLAKLAPKPQPAAQQQAEATADAGQQAEQTAEAEQQAEQTAEQQAEQTAEQQAETAPQAKASSSDSAAKPQPKQPAAARPVRETRPPVAVIMYATPWCEICDRAREFLLARGAVLTEYDIDSDRVAEKRLAKLNVNASVPTFEIGGRAYVGFNPWELEDAMRAASAASTATATAQAKAARAR